MCLIEKADARMHAKPSLLPSHFMISPKKKIRFLIDALIPKFVQVLLINKKIMSWWFYLTRELAIHIC